MGQSSCKFMDLPLVSYFHFSEGSVMGISARFCAE